MCLKFASHNQQETQTNTKQGDIWTI